MDTSRLIINTIDKSSYNVEESTSIVGFTVVEAPKGPIYPVRIPAGGSARIKDIFGVSSKEYPELFEVETFNREYDVYVSAPYGTGTKVNVAYITDDGIFPGYEPITYDKDLESVIMGFEDDSTVEGFASMMGIDGTVSVMKDYRYPKSSNMPGADSDLGGGYYPDYESTENGENVITASTGLTSLSGVEKLRLVIPPYSYDLTIDSNNILDKGTEIVGKIEESEGKKVLEFEGSDNSSFIKKTLIKNLSTEDSRKKIEIYYVVDMNSSQIHGAICPKYPSSRDVHIGFDAFDPLTGYTRKSRPNVLRMTVYEDGAFRDYSHRVRVSGSLDITDTDSSGGSIGFSDSNDSYSSQELIYVYTYSAFTKDTSSIYDGMSSYPPITIHGGTRQLSDNSDGSSFTSIDLHNIGWEKASDSEFSDVSVFFNSADYSSKSLSDIKRDDIFFSLAGSGRDGHNLAGYRFNYSVAPSTIDSTFSSDDYYLDFGRNYWNVCNMAIMSLSDGSRFFSPMTGAAALMDCRIKENRYGGVAPMWENSGSPGMGGQLTMINPQRLRYKYNKSHLSKLDKFNYNPVINDRQFGVMMTSHKTCKSGDITDWSYIGHVSSFFDFIREVRNNVMIPQIGKKNNPYYRELRAEQVRQYLRQRTEGDNRIWAEGIVDTSTADGVNDEYALKSLKFVINVSVKVDIFSEFVELNFTNEDQATTFSTEE